MRAPVETQRLLWGAALCAAVLLVQVPVVLADAQGSDGLIGDGKLGSLLGKGKAGPDIAAFSVAMGKGKGRGLEYPPAPTDWSAGICTGYPFCVPPVIPPTLAEPSVSCPKGFTPDGSGACVSSQAICMFGAQMTKGKCCVQKTTTTCFASLEAACPSGCNSLGSLCAPNKSYMDVVNVLQVQEVPNLSYKEAADGKAWFKLGLPMFDLGKGALIAGAKAAIESKLVGVSTLGKGKGWGKGKGSWAKVDVVPQCFSKCCRSENEVVCMEPKVRTMYAPNLANCPLGCAGPISGACVCNPGGPAPCPPGTDDCPSPAGRICVSKSLCYGLNQCKIASILMPHLPPVTCPGGPPATPVPAPAAPTASAAAKATAAASAGGK